eukprot:gene30175-28849_t
MREVLVAFARSGGYAAEADRDTDDEVVQAAFKWSIEHHEPYHEQFGGYKGAAAPGAAGAASPGAAAGGTGAAAPPRSGGRGRGRGAPPRRPPPQPEWDEMSVVSTLEEAPSY